MSIRAQSVAVIGAGPAGAIATDALVKEQAFERIRVFERRPAIGGTWIFTPHLPAAIPNLPDLIHGNVDLAVQIPDKLPAETPKSEAVNSHQVRFSDTPQHDNLHSNITPEIMTFTQEPFPDTLSEYTLKVHGPGAPFRHREVVRQWVEDIIVKNGNADLVELNTTVERAVKNNRNKWVLTLRKEGPLRDHWWEEEFDALVVATGHYNVPWIPDIPGLLEYEETRRGSIVHSKHLRHGSQFKGKRVVVVGGSVSASEVIHEILPYAQHPVVASLREPIAAFGWVPFEHPHIDIRRPISRFEPETGRIVFEDGSSVENIDHVIFGTGFTFSLPFLPHVQKRIKAAHRRLPGVYQHTWDIEDPSLTFVGLLGGGFTFRVFEWQAVAIARHLASRAAPLPPTSEQRQWEVNRVKEVVGGNDYCSSAPDYEEYFEFLRGIAGDPAPGTTGRVLPPFDKKWLDLWAVMTAPKIRGWKNARKEAEEEEVKKVRAKL